MASSTLQPKDLIPRVVRIIAKLYSIDMLNHVVVSDITVLMYITNKEWRYAWYQLI